MFPGSASASGLSIGKIAGGISKTLGIVNQAIPIYKEVKPIVQKVGGVFNIYKEFKKAPSVNSNSNNYVNNSNLNINQNFINKTSKTKTQDNNLNPVFFQ